MSEYESVRKGKLVLKGETSSKKRKHKKDKESKTEKKFKPVVDEDALKHGGWWRASKIEEVTGSIAIQFGKQAYIKALDNGLFILGAVHGDNQGPDPEEILTAIHINENLVAFKSGYGKYLRVEKDGLITGRSDAVSSLEQFDVVFQDGKLAIQCANKCFMSVDSEDDSVVAIMKTATDNEIAVIRSIAPREMDKGEIQTDEQSNDLKQLEINHVKKFQKFQDKKLRINPGDRSTLKKAQEDGSLFEALLDRRSKVKADRYCK